MQPKPDTDIPNECMPRDILMQEAMVRLGEIDQEIQAGYNILRKYPRTVTIFGSARMLPDDKFYQQARDLSALLSHKGYTIISGGGFGIMSAANQGAHEAIQSGAAQAGGESIGFNIKLPHEQTLNSYVTESYEFSHFAPRKIVMTLFANAYIFFPGGFGTLDELSEILTLIQTGKTAKAPVLLVGSEFWSTFDRFVAESLLDRGYITDDDRQLYHITDDIEEVARLVDANQMYCHQTLPPPKLSAAEDVSAAPTFGRGVQSGRVHAPAQQTREQFSVSDY